MSDEKQLPNEVLAGQWWIADVVIFAAAAASVLLPQQHTAFSFTIPGATRWVIPSASLQEVEGFLLFTYMSEMHLPEHILGLMDLCQRFNVQDGYKRCLHYCQRHV
eukprot:EG_transcript_65494